ncbi:MAG: hypothetical protein AAF658_01315 [Myxococcota bacterium]
MSVDVAEVTDNLRTMLRMNAKRFGLMVERQVQVALLPKVQGPRAALEEPLWELLVLLVDGHEATAPPITEEALEDWFECAESAVNHARTDRAAFPKAAAAVARAMRALHEHGVLPPPLTATESAG